MKHYKMMQHIIHKVYKSVNCGHSKMQEALGHGCPIGMESIPLSDSIETRIARTLPVYKGVVILKSKQQSPEKLIYKGIIYYREPLAPRYVPPHQNSEQYIQECKENFNRIVQERLENDTAYEKDGIVWYRSKK